MDLSKLNIDTLDGSNWGTWAAQVQSAARILSCWDVIKGEIVVPLTSPPMYNLLTQPTAATQPDAALLATELAAWTKKNSTALGVIQGKTSSAIWPEYVNHATADTLWTALEIKYGKAGGATTYLQVVSLYKVHMTDSMSLLPKIQISKKITCRFGQTVTHNYWRTLPHLYFVLLYHHHTRTSHHSI